MRKKALAISVCILIVLSLLTGCKSSSSGNKDTILIGVSAPVTGTNAEHGVYMSEGINLAVSQINASGGVLGKNLKTITEDDQATQSGAVNAANLLKSKNVVAVIGPYFSTCVQAADPIFAKNKIPYITGATSYIFDNLGDPYFFRDRVSDSLTSPSLAKYAVDTLNSKRAGIMYNNDSMGTSGRDLMETYLKKSGVACFAEGHNTGDKDFSAALSKLKSDNIDTLIVWTQATETAEIAKQALQLGMTNINKLSSASFSMDSVISLSGQPASEGWYCAADYVNDTTDSNQLKFEKEFTAKYHTTAELYAAANYTATYLFANAIKNANSTDSKQIQKALRETKNYVSILGPETCDSNGNMMHQMNIAKIHNMIPKIVGVVKA